MQLQLYVYSELSFESLNTMKPTACALFKQRTVGYYNNLKQGTWSTV